MVSLSLAAAAILLVAQPQPSGPPPGERVPFAMPEVSDAQCDALFKQYDANHDGKLSFTEYADGEFGQLRFVEAPSAAMVAGHKNKSKREAAACDRNKDGFLSLLEHRTACRQGTP